MTGGCFGVRVQHSLGVSRSVCSWYWGRLGLGTLALTSLVTVQVQVVRGVLECWTLAVIPILATQVLGSLLQFKYPTRDGGFGETLLFGTRYDIYVYFGQISLLYGLSQG